MCACVRVCVTVCVVSLVCVVWCVSQLHDVSPRKIHVEISTPTTLFLYSATLTLSSCASFTNCSNPWIPIVCVAHAYPHEI